MKFRTFVIAPILLVLSLALLVSGCQVVTPEPEPAAEPGAEAEPAEPTIGDMKRMFRDFRITQPQNEETFWGAGNQVTVSWGSSQPFLDGMRVIVYVNGEGRQGPPSGSLTLSPHL